MVARSYLRNNPIDSHGFCWFSAVTSVFRASRSERSSAKHAQGNGGKERHFVVAESVVMAVGRGGEVLGFTCAVGVGAVVARGG